MIRNQPKPKTCSNCDYHGIFFGKKCGRCRQKSWNNNRVKNRKPSGELAFFIEIWNERPHFSEVSGKPLGSFNVSFFSHLLNKGNYPKFRLNKENIMLKTIEEHNAYEFRRHEIKNDPKWKHVFERREKLRNEYTK